MMRYYFRSIDSETIKKRRCFSTIDDDYILLLPIKLIRYCINFLFFWDWHKIDSIKLNYYECVALFAVLRCFAAPHAGLMHARDAITYTARRTREIFPCFFFLFQMCTNYLWLVAAASLHVRLFDAAFKPINGIIIIMHCTCADI